MSQLQPRPQQPRAPPRSPTTLSHEEAVHREPSSLSHWLHYVSHIASSTSSLSSTFPIYERALAHLPTSYKLWCSYLDRFHTFSLPFHPSHPVHVAFLNIARRAANSLPQSPVLWSSLLHALLQRAQLAEARRTLKDALQSLPLTQHAHVWSAIFHFEKHLPKHWLAIMWYRRATVWPSEYAVNMVKSLVNASMYGKAQQVVTSLLSSPSSSLKINRRREKVPLKFKPRGCTVAQLTILAGGGPSLELILSNVNENRRNRQIIQQQQHITENFKSIQGNDLHNKDEAEQADALYAELVTTSATHHARNGQFDKARHTLENGLTLTFSPHEFSIIFEAYTKLETTIADSIPTNTVQGQQQLETQISRLESLVARRPHLLSDTILRQNPHNVSEWLRRARLLRGDNSAVVAAYSTAVRTVNPAKASAGKASTLWLAFASFYTRAGEKESAYQVLNTALERSEEFINGQEIASVYISLAETQIQFGDLKDAYHTLSKVLISGTDFPKNDSGNEWWWKKAWNLFVDIVHTRGDANDVENVHFQMIDSKAATAQSILSGVTLFESIRLFSRAFKLYDHAVGALRGVQRVIIWTSYLKLAILRFGKQKPERIRDLFENCISSQFELLNNHEENGNGNKDGKKIKKWIRKEMNEIATYSKYFYVSYAEFEFVYGNMKNGLDILKRACQHVQNNDDLVQLFRMRIVKTIQQMGVSASRIVYEEALKTVREDEHVAEFSVRFAKMEERLGEIDRARAVFYSVGHKIEPIDRIGGGGGTIWFWKEWEQFEKRAGEIEDVKEMLRFKRRVEIDFGSKGALV